MSKPNGKLVGGVWLPVTETHFVEMMQPGSKRFLEVDGKWTYQYHKLEAAMKYQPDNRRRVCLDIGAHVGLWSMWLVKYFEKVCAFEPIGVHVDLFRRNVDMSNVALYQTALGDCDGETVITGPEDETGSFHIETGDDTDARRGTGKLHREACQLTTVDRLDLAEVDFIKIDVEGFELQVLKGAQNTIREWQPNIVVEQKGNEQFYGQERDQAAEYLRSLGYRSAKVIAGDHIMVPR